MYDSNPKIDQRISFMFITKDADKKNNDFCIKTNHYTNLEPGNGKFESYEGNTRDSTNVDFIAWQAANQRVQNWKKDSIRQIWINAQFEQGDTNIFQAFVINGIDFEGDVKHDCYLALKDTVIGKETIYTADLIIVNTVTKKVVSLTKTGNETNALEDVTAPNPPFKPTSTSRTDEEYFGLLESIKTQ